MEHNESNMPRTSEYGITVVAAPNDLLQAFHVSVHLTDHVNQQAAIFKEFPVLYILLMPGCNNPHTSPGGDDNTDEEQ